MEERRYPIKRNNHNGLRLGTMERDVVINHGLMGLVPRNVYQITSDRQAVGIYPNNMTRFRMGEDIVLNHESNISLESS